MKLSLRVNSPGSGIAIVGRCKSDLASLRPLRWNSFYPDLVKLHLRLEEIGCITYDIRRIGDFNAGAQGDITAKYIKVAIGI